MAISFLLENGARLRNATAEEKKKRRPETLSLRNGFPGGAMPHTVMPAGFPTGTLFLSDQLDAPADKRGQIGSCKHALGKQSQVYGLFGQQGPGFII